MSTTTTPVRIPGHRTVTRRLGRWTTDRDFEVRANRGIVVLDLRSPEIPDGDIRVDVDLDHAVLKLLVAPDAVIDDWNLRRTGRGKVSDPEAPGDGVRRIIVTGRLADAQIRVRRGGLALLNAMFTREYLSDLRRVHREGGFPTVDDPTRTS